MALVGECVRHTNKRGKGWGRLGQFSRGCDAAVGVGCAAPRTRRGARRPEDKRAAVIACGGMSTLYAPMISGERGVGSLLVGRRPKRPFSEAEIASLSAFADQATIAIENARLFREAQARTRELEDAL